MNVIRKSRMFWMTIVIPGLSLAQIELPNGTKVACRLEQTITSATAEEGQQVQLSVMENIKVGDTIAIAQGAPAMGTITQALAKRRMGRTGKLDFSIEKVRAVDGEYVPLRYSMNKREGGSHATSTGVMTAGAAVLFWPAAPVFLLRKGKDVTIHKGVVFEVFTDQDHVLKSTASAAAREQKTATAAAPSSSEGTSAVSITSDVQGSEVEVDGVFVGSTPATRQLPAGTHKITVRHGAQVWQRDLQVQAGSPVTVNAILKK